MKQNKLHLALLFLLERLSNMKDAPTYDKALAIALTEVLQYFKDNGELQKAMANGKAIMEEQAENPVYCQLVSFFYNQIKARHPEMPTASLKDLVTEFWSEEKVKERVDKWLRGI